MQTLQKMEAIKRTKVKREGNKITLILPDNFDAEEVDVLIWPSNEEIVADNTNLSAQLLTWPVMSDDELALINQKRKHINAWK